MTSGLSRIIHPVLAGLMLLVLVAPMLCFVNVSLCPYEPEWLVEFYIWYSYGSGHYMPGWYFILAWFYMVTVCLAHPSWWELQVLVFISPALFSLGFVLLIVLGLFRAVLVRQWLSRLHRVLIGITVASLLPTVFSLYGEPGEDYPRLYAGFWLSAGLVLIVGLIEVVLYVISRRKKAAVDDGGASPG